MILSDVIEARIYLVHYRVSFPQPGRLFFSVAGVRKRDGYTSNFLDKSGHR